MTVSTRREKEQWKSDLRAIFASLLFTKLRRMKWYPPPPHTHTHTYTILYTLGSFGNGWPSLIGPLYLSIIYKKNKQNEYGERLFWRPKKMIFQRDRRSFIRSWSRWCWYDRRVSFLRMQFSPTAADLITVIFRCVAGLSRAQTTYTQNKICQISYQPLVSSVYIYWQQLCWLKDKRRFL